MPFDPTITQKVRTQLLEDGHSELVVESLAEHFKVIEQHLELLARDVRLLQIADQKRVTDTGVQRIIDAKIGAESLDWVKWGIRALVLGAGGFIARLAWKGLHAP